MSGPPLLEVKSLAKHFPIRSGFLGRKVAEVKAVDGLDFHIGVGRTFGLVGESGCGKTTIAMLLVKLLEPTSGHIYLDGQSIAGMSGSAVMEFRRKVQIVFQDPYGSLDPRQTVLKALMEPLFTLRLAAARAQAVDRAVESLRLVGLDAEVVNRLPHELSGGQRQRVAIARAVAVEPRFLILDEPTSSVDVSIQAQILSLLEELKRRRGLTYLLISHNLVVVRYMSDAVAVMYLGKIVEMAESAELFAHPLHPYSSALISAIPVPDPEAPRMAVLAKGDISSPVKMPSGCRYHPRCPFAERACREVDPPLSELGRGHYVACHFPGIGGRGQDPLDGGHGLERIEEGPGRPE